MALLTRAAKGSGLTNNEIDGNFLYLEGLLEPVTTALQDAATTVWDYSAGNVATWTANGSRTLQIVNLPSGYCQGFLYFRQGIAGGYTPTLGGIPRNGFAIAPGADALTELKFTKIGNTLLWDSVPYGALPPVSGGGGDGPTQTTLAQSQAALQTYINRVTNTGAVLSTNRRTAITDLVSGIFQAGLYDKIIEFYPILGGTAAAHAISFKGSYDLTFSGAVVHSATGFLTNGTDSVARTGLIPNIVLNKDSASMGYYGRTQTQNSGDVMGARQGNDIAMRLVVRDQSSDRLFSEIGSANQRIDLGGGGASSQGLFITNRNSPNYFAVYRNGQVLGTNTDANSGTLPTGDIYLGGLNNNGVNTNLSANECGWGHIAIGFTDPEVATFSSLVQQYQTTLGRAV